MTDYRKYTDYIIEQAEKLLSIDSPSGYCRQVTDYQWTIIFLPVL